MTTASMIIILNCTMLLTSATVTAIHSVMLYKELKRNVD